MYGRGQFDYMVRQGPQVMVTEDYVASPPSLKIDDEAGIRWTLGAIEYPDKRPCGEYAFMVLANGLPMGEVASRIERRGGKIRIFTQSGWKRWSGSSFI